MTSWTVACMLLCLWSSLGKNTGEAILFYRDSSQPRDRTWVAHIAGRFFWATREVSKYIWSTMILAFPPLWLFTPVPCKFWVTCSPRAPSSSSWEREKGDCKQHLCLGWGWWFNHQDVSDSCDSVDCSLPSSSVHGILQARITGVGCHFLLQGIFSIQE